MRPSTLWHHRRPLVRWGLFGLLLATVSAGLYVMLPPEPRWERALEPHGVFDAGAGRIASYTKGEDGDAGPLRLLDAATGDELAQFLTDAPKLNPHGRSGDGRTFVALVPDRRPTTWCIRGVDLQEQREWQADTPLGPFESATFSLRCDYVTLRVKASDKEQSYVIHETATGRIVAQMRIPASTYSVAFSDDGARFVVADEVDGMLHIAAVHTRTGRETTLEDGRLLAVAPDAQCLIADCGDDGVWVADLAEGSWRCRLAEARLPRAQAVDQGTFLRYYSRLSLRGMKTQRWGISLRVRSNRAHSATSRGIMWLSLPDVANDAGPSFSPDGRRVLWREAREAGAFLFRMYDVQTGQALWQQTWKEAPSRDPLFTPDSRHMLLPFVDAGRVDVHDAVTGAIERTIALPQPHGGQALLAADGRTLIVTRTLPEPEPFWLWAKILEWLPDRPEPAPLMTVRIFDVATGTLQGEATCEETGEWWLTEDRRSLITVYHDSDEDRAIQTVIQCWDIPPHRPLRWIVGVPLALGVALVSLRFGWRRWRRPRKAAA